MDEFGVYLGTLRIEIWNIGQNLASLHIVEHTERERERGATD